MRAMIAHHQALVGTLLAEALRARGFDVKVSPLAAADHLLATVRDFKPAVVLVEIPPRRDAQAVALVRRLHGVGTPLVLVSGPIPPLALAEYLEAGVADIVSKAADIEVVVRVVTTVVTTGCGMPAGQRRALQRALVTHQQRAAPLQRLTRREAEVLAALVEGKDARSIAAAASRSVRTVRGQIQSVLDKLEVRSQIAAVAKAKAVGWVPPAASRQPRD